ncbi:Fatty acid oxygenase [Neofusicoccum parvum]|nr:Fatty acid oxygenase [Neofusicoccum parvum]
MCPLLLSLNRTLCLTESVRTYKDGRLKPDAFSDVRILGQPPGVCALLVAFNRYHNWVVEELAANNEDDRFPSVESLKLKFKDQQYREKVVKRDEDLFQTGRLITCGLYVNIILGDYLRTILNLNSNPVNSNWTLDPRKAFEGEHIFDQKGIPMGMGNQVSAEFNFVYRWHCAVSNRDQKWMEEFIPKKIMEGRIQHWSEASPDELRRSMIYWAIKQKEQDPEDRTFEDAEGKDIPRQENKQFPDDPLIELLCEGTDNVAGAYGARNVPAALKFVENLGIKQGREWGLATFNEFRRFFNLKEFKSFKEINSQPGVAEALETLYGHPDNVELYVGLMVEEAKQPFSPGSGLCPGFTISEAILADAVALVRGDRFYSIEWGPQSLTKWGFAEITVDDNVAGGGALYKLLMRAFPQWYTPNSVYALYPFSTPERTRELVQTGALRNVELNYNRPKRAPLPKAICSWKAVHDVLCDQQRFKVPWGEHTWQMIGRDYMLSGDTAANAKQRVAVNRAMYEPADTLDRVRSFYEAITGKLIYDNRRRLDQGFQIDIVKDIGNLAHATFTAKYFGIPLSGPVWDWESGHWKYSGAEKLYNKLARLFEYVFLDLDPTKSYKHRVTASAEAQKLAHELRRSLHSIRSPGWFGPLKHILDHLDPLNSFGKGLAARLLGSGKDVEQVVWEVIPTAAAASATQAQAWGQMIEVYFRDENKHHWHEIVRLAKSDSHESFELLRKYVLEGFRLSPAASGVIRVAATAATIPDGQENGQAREVNVGPGEPLFLSFIEAGLDPEKFPNPQEINPHRPEESYIHHGWGPHSCLGQKIVPVAAAAMLRVFARECSDPQRTPGPAGKMKRRDFKVALPAIGADKRENWKGFPQFMAEDGSEWKNFPTSMKLIYGQPIKATLKHNIVVKNPEGDVIGHVKGHIKGHVHDPMNGGPVGHVNGFVNGQVDGYVVGNVDGHADGHADGHWDNQENGHGN